MDAEEADRAIGKRRRLRARRLAKSCEERKENIEIWAKSNALDTDGRGRGG